MSLSTIALDINPGNGSATFIPSFPDASAVTAAHIILSSSAGVSKHDLADFTDGLTVSGLTNGIDYTAILVQQTSSGFLQSEVSYTFKCVDPPVAPTIGELTVSDVQIVVPFSWTTADAPGATHLILQVITASSIDSIEIPLADITVDVVGDTSSVSITLSDGVGTNIGANVSGYTAMENDVEHTIVGYLMSSIDTGGSENVSIAGAVSSAKSGTPDDLPGAPSSVSASSGTYGVTASLTWGVPSVNDASIASYQVRLADGSDNDIVAWTSADSDSAHSFSGLTIGTDYVAHVRAVNGNNDPGASDSSSFTTHDKPDAITDLAGSVGTSEKVNLSWTAPSANGSAITSYDYRVYSSGAWSNWTTTGSTDASYTVEELENFVSVDVQVRAVNLIGSADASNTLSVIPTINTLPDATITPVQDVVRGSNYDVTISIVPPQGRNDVDYTGENLVVEKSDDNGSTWSAVTGGTKAYDSLPYTISDTSAGSVGDEILYRLTATAAITGVGETSREYTSSVVTIAAPPSIVVDSVSNGTTSSAVINATLTGSLTNLVFIVFPSNPGSSADIVHEYVQGSGAIDISGSSITVTPGYAIGANPAYISIVSSAVGGTVLNTTGTGNNA